MVIKEDHTCALNEGHAAPIHHVGVLHEGIPIIAIIPKRVVIVAIRVLIIVIIAMLLENGKHPVLGNLHSFATASYVQWLALSGVFLRVLDDEKLGTRLHLNLFSPPTMLANDAAHHVGWDHYLKEVIFITATLVIILLLLAAAWGMRWWNTPLDKHIIKFYLLHV